MERLETYIQQGYPYANLPEHIKQVRDGETKGGRRGRERRERVCVCVCVCVCVSVCV